MFCFSFLTSDIKKPFLSAPLLDWNVVQRKMPWSIVLLLGGGFALADASAVCPDICFSVSKANFPGLLSSPVLLGMHPKPNPAEMFRSGGRSKLAKTGRRGECLCLFFRNLYALTKFLQFILPLGGCWVVWDLHWLDRPEKQPFLFLLSSQSQPWLEK